MDNQQLRLTISDTGIGIQDAHIAHIFDRFYQVDDSRTRAYEGTGIGLALVKELTELLGGTITVQSRTEAPTGTTFTVTLPIRPATDLADAPAVRLPTASTDAAWPIAPSATETSLAPNPSITDDAPLVLVVDDNEELRTFVANELAHQYRVLTAADGEEAWVICQHELPDVVADVMMPRMDGYQSAPSVSTQEPVLDPFVNQLQEAIESRLDDTTFGVDDLAQAAAMSRRTLHRRLTTTTNLTANEFIRHYRLRRATQLLQTGLSIAETAYQVGFENPGYFTKVFKQTYQQTPTEFVGS